MSTSSISRRGFVGAVAGAAVVGAAGVAKADEAANWTAEADLIFIGAGCSGAYGARLACEAGASVIVLEKMDRDNAGGDTLCYGGILSATMFETLKNNSFGQISDYRAQAIADASEDMAAWFVEKTDVKMREDSPIVAQGAGRSVYGALRDALEACGADVRYENKAVEIIMEDGQAAGVVAECNGETLRYKANKAVVITTGGYEANNEMIRELHYPMLQTVSAGHPSIQGDGIKMALAAGAKLGNIGTGIDWFEFAFAAPSREFGTSIDNRQWSTFTGFGGGRNNEPHPSKIFVNMDGRRFMDETRVLTHDKSICMPFVELDYQPFGVISKGYKNMPMFLVCDADCVASGPLGACPTDDEWTYKNVFGIYHWSDDNQAEVEKGWLLKADTIEELAAMMTAANYMSGKEQTVDAEALAASIAEYNALCETGEADPYGRPAELMQPIVTPPFYAAEMMPSIVYTIGGLVSGDDSQVIGTDGEAIPRLYCAGNVGQGMDMVPYTVAGCMGSSAVAVAHALALDPRE